MFSTYKGKDIPRRLFCSLILKKPYEYTKQIIITWLHVAILFTEGEHPEVYDWLD